MSKKKRIILWILIPIVALVMIVGTIVWIGVKKVENGGTYVTNSLLIPYSYTIYEDHVTLERYRGKKTEVVIPETVWGKPVTVIGYECFDHCKEVVSVRLHENIEVIDTLAFNACSNLKEVIDGKNVRSIKPYAFNLCKKLETVEMGNKIEIIENGAFDKCEMLKKMNEQNNLNYIGQYAFYGAGLEKFEFNKKAEVGSSAFSESKWIQNQEEEFVIYGDGILVGYNGTDKIVHVPEGVKVINGSFIENMGIEEVYLPDTVKEIRDFAFSDCQNVRVYIPASVSVMGDEDGYPILSKEDSITIITTKDTFAGRYAMGNKIPYEIVEEW